MNFKRYISAVLFSATLLGHATPALAKDTADIGKSRVTPIRFEDPETRG